MDIGGWLRSLGLERYEPAFVQNAIDTDVLPELTEGDLETLGIPLGDRKLSHQGHQGDGGRLSRCAHHEAKPERGRRAATRRRLAVSGVI